MNYAKQNQNRELAKIHLEGVIFGRKKKLKITKKTKVIVGIG
jgi:hypothetical protein